MRLKPCHQQKISPKMNSKPTVDNSLHWENPRICCTCMHYQQNRCNLTAFHFEPEHPACERYIAKNTD